VAKHLGVSKSTVINWADRPTAAFPQPFASVRYGDAPRQETPAWTRKQLPALREWLAHRLELSDPASHWEAVGRGEEYPGGHQDQEALFGGGAG
jgi:transposase